MHKTHSSQHMFERRPQYACVINDHKKSHKTDSNKASALLFCWKKDFLLLTFSSVGISLTVNGFYTQRITFSWERTLRFKIPLCVGEERTRQTIKQISIQLSQSLLECSDPNKSWGNICSLYRHFKMAWFKGVDQNCRFFWSNYNDNKRHDLSKWVANCIFTKRGHYSERNGSAILGLIWCYCSIYKYFELDFILRYLDFILLKLYLKLKFFFHYYFFIFLYSFNYLLSYSFE